MPEGEPQAQPLSDYEGRISLKIDGQVLTARITNDDNVRTAYVDFLIPHYQAQIDALRGEMICLFFDFESCKGWEGGARKKMVDFIAENRDCITLICVYSQSRVIHFGVSGVALLVGAPPKIVACESYERFEGAVKDPEKRTLMIEGSDQEAPKT